jgi:small redox-active disulfide protein 2
MEITDQQEKKIMEIKVFGPGCPKCKKLYQASVSAVERLGNDDHVIKVEDLQEMLSLGIMQTPTLMIDGKIVVSGRVPSVPEIVRLIEAAQ